MKMKKTLSLFLFAILGFSALAQNNIPTMEAVDDIWRTQEMKDGALSITHSAIAGNPYLNKEFKKGQPISKYNMKFPVIPLRYNIYTDNIEYKSPENKIFALKDEDKIQGYTIDDTTLIYSTFYEKKNKLSSGYFQVLTPGKVMGLLRYTVYLLQAQPERPYIPAKPERFSPVSKSFYLKIGNTPATVVSKMKEVVQLFPKQKNQLNQFVKKEGIRLQKQDDFMKLVQYINTLTNTTKDNKK